MKVFGNFCEVIVKFFHLARVIDALFRCNAMLHAAMKLARKICRLRVASSVETFDAAIINNHDHRAS